MKTVKIYTLLRPYNINCTVAYPVLLVKPSSVDNNLHFIKMISQAMKKYYIF